MIKTTRKQREAIRKIYLRNVSDSIGATATVAGYRALRKTIRPLLGDPRCVMLHWRGMWLGIESDGYTHS